MKRAGLLLQLLAVWLAAVGALAPVDERLIGWSLLPNCVLAAGQGPDRWVARSCTAGWLGETYGKGGVNSSVAAQDRPGMQILSWDPRIMLYRKFLSEGELVGEARMWGL
jgi:hypothetical protein